jgi:hypothetical protein
MAARVVVARPAGGCRRRRGKDRVQFEQDRQPEARATRMRCDAARPGERRRRSPSYRVGNVEVGLGRHVRRRAICRRRRRG